MPDTPPPSESAPPIADSPSKKRVWQQDTASLDIDTDATPRNIIRHRPILDPKPPSSSKRDRSASPSSPIRSVVDLTRLEKPVTIVPAVTAAGNDILQQASLQGVCRSIRRILRYSEFVPVEVQNEFSALIRHRGDEVEDAWFAPHSHQIGERLRPVEELGRLLDIHHEALEAVTLGKHEAAWNSAVHHPLLAIAFDDGRDALTGERVVNDIRLRVENVTTATIAGECLPRLGMPHEQSTQLERDTSDTGSIGAWSISQVTASSASSAGGISVTDGSVRDELRAQAVVDSQPFIQATGLRAFHLDSTVHSKAGSKKVDFAIVCMPRVGTGLHTAIQTVLDRLKSKSLSYSISPSTYGPLVDVLMIAAIETKTITASRNPLVQLGLMSVAIHRRLHTLPVPRATGSRPLTGRTGMIPPLPMIAVTDHQWQLYLACDQGDSIVSPQSPRRTFEPLLI